MIPPTDLQAPPGAHAQARGGRALGACGDCPALRGAPPQRQTEPRSGEGGVGAHVPPAPTLLKSIL